MSGFSGKAEAHGQWAFVARRADGSVKWVERINNLVTTEGKNHALSVTLDAGTQETSWYVGLTANSPSPAAGDTMASHGGWTEVTAYDEAVRQTWTGGTASGGSIDNSANKATITCSTNGTGIGGAFLVTNNTKGGSTGTLYAVGAFSGGNKTLDDDETLDITATFTL